MNPLLRQARAALEAAGVSSAADVLPFLRNPSDRSRHAAVAEIASALHYGTTSWASLPPDLLERFDLPRYPRGQFPDMGIDSMTPRPLDSGAYWSV